MGFTVLALSLFVIQMKMAIFNVFQGLVYFLLPLLLVAVNDSFAYFSGYCFGRKVFGERVFLSLSPNKTWEGFIGGGLFTMVAGWLLPPLLASPWLACSYMDIEKFGVDGCTVPPHFVANASGIAPIQYHGLVLALFASLVAPFGGFFASAIKRAYGLKDFGSFIPGHGGFMDRLDCQFLMALYTWVHLTTFIIPVTSDVDRAAGLIRHMSEEDREVLKELFF